MKVKVMITDDQRLIRELLKTLLDLEEDMTVVELAENGQDALNKLEVVQPDIMLMDIRMPVMDGVECTRILKQRYPHIKVIILTTFDDDAFIIEALKGGAAGYILKDLSSEKLVNAIRDVYQGNSIMQPEIAAKVISHISGTSTAKEQGNYSSSCTSDPSAGSGKGEGMPQHPANHSDERLNRLTEREKDVLRLVGRGMSNPEIAGTLFISEGTVKNYLSNLYSKLQIDDRSKLTLFAAENQSL